MYRNIINALVLLLSLFISAQCFEKECSKFHYEEQLLEKMIRLEVKFETLLENVGKLESSIKEERRMMKKERVYEEEELDTWMKTKDELIADNVEQLENTLDEYTAKLENLSADLLTTQNKTLEETLGTIKSKATKAVAFEAHVVPNLDPKIGERIVFTDTKLNEGNGYDNTTGVFTVPQDGNYLLMVQFCLQSERYLHFDFLWNGIILLSTKFYRGPGDYACYSTQTVVKASIGDDIWLDVNHNHTSNVLFNNRYYVNSFTGVLIN